MISRVAHEGSSDCQERAPRGRDGLWEVSKAGGAGQGVLSSETFVNGALLPPLRTPDRHLMIQPYLAPFTARLQDGEAQL